MYILVNFIVLGIHLLHCFTINISGENYIVPGVPYKVTCTVSDFLENRKTIYAAIISSDDITEFKIFDLKIDGCMYKPSKDYFPCQSSICSCDKDGLFTHWTYRTPTDLSSSVNFRCTSKNNEGYLITSNPWMPTVTSKCFLVLILNKFYYS